MPWSSEDGKVYVEHVARSLKPSSVLDVGPGSGTYAQRLRPQLPESRWEAVEVWPPYVGRFKLRALYDVVHVCSIVDFEWRERYNLVIMGDVLEHLEPFDAMAVWDQARLSADWVIASLPNCHWDQGAVEGNPYEAHLSHYTPEIFKQTFDGVVNSWQQGDIGVYLAEGTMAIA